MLDDNLIEVTSIKYEEQDHSLDLSEDLSEDLSKFQKCIIKL